MFYTLAGPEISVATTKAYSAQLVAMYCLAVQFAKVRGKITDEQYGYYISELQTIPEKLQKVLEDKERIQWFAAKYANARDVFFVGRGIDYAVCLEGSLKLKEISYIHSEAYAAATSNSMPAFLPQNAYFSINSLLLLWYTSLPEFLPS